MKVECDKLKMWVVTLEYSHPKTKFRKRYN